jgi:hypothetical protein
MPRFCGRRVTRTVTALNSAQHLVNGHWAKQVQQATGYRHIYSSWWRPCGVALDAVPNLMVEYINKGFLEYGIPPNSLLIKI